MRDALCDPRALEIDRLHLVAGAKLRELETIGAKRIGLEDVGAGPEVLAVDLGHELRLSQVQLIERSIEKDALGIEHRAHGAIAHEHALIESLEKPLHGGRPLASC